MPNANWRGRGHAKCQINAVAPWPAPPALQVREELGFRPLVIVVIGLIYSRQRASKLSSTDLREDDAAAGGGGAGGGSRSGSPR